MYVDAYQLHCGHILTRTNIFHLYLCLNKVCGSISIILWTYFDQIKVQLVICGQNFVPNILTNSNRSNISYFTISFLVAVIHILIYKVSTLWIKSSCVVYCVTLCFA
jgi:hypothetical protein